jgi:hypothetical protein
MGGGERRGCGVIVRLLDQVVYLVFVMPLVVAPFMLFKWIRYVSSTVRGSTVPRRLPVVSLGLFGVPILLGFAIVNIIASTARSEVRTFLNGLQETEVSINGVVVANPTPVLNALRSMTMMPLHHSSPTTRVHIVIRSNKGDLAVDLARDSHRAQEYWVFYPRYVATNSNEIDRIISSDFDSY